MISLLEKYSMSDILMFLIIFSLAMKELVTLIDWVKAKIKNAFDEELHAKEESEEIKEEIEELNKFYSERKRIDDTFDRFDKMFDTINNQIAMLIDSDRESIKAYITERHHYFVYEQGWIDDYSMECLEKRFAVYEKEHGNSFVRGLMNEVRGLPKRPPEEVEHKYIGTAEHIKNANR